MDVSAPNFHIVQGSTVTASSRDSCFKNFPVQKWSMPLSCSGEDKHTGLLSYSGIVSQKSGTHFSNMDTECQTYPNLE